MLRGLLIHGRFWGWRGGVGGRGLVYAVLDHGGDGEVGFPVDGDLSAVVEMDIGSEGYVGVGCCRSS